jgi:acyl-CoA synthetase (AMP-forming)/AMP-acid ligase II
MSGAADHLPFLPGDAEFVARRGGQPIPRGAFLGEIVELAELLPDRPFVVNLCADRVRFAIALAAAMLRGQLTLLPSAGSAAAIGELCEDYSGLYALTDDGAADALPCASFAYPALPGAASGDAPSFPAGQVAAVLFTSGSTGKPQPSRRSWGRLVAGSLSAGAALGIDAHIGAALVATVPHAHSYGLESALMLPLQHGLLLDAERPFFQGDVAAALRDGARPGVLVTTPVHLRALVGEAGLAAGLVLSATAPLPNELARQAEAAFGVPVFEIYGCSEAGQLAARRTVAGDVWRCLSGFRVRQDAAGSWACGPFEPDVLLSDDLALHGPDAFTLRGRLAGLVNVAGKRSSLDHLTAQLLAIEGVEDGAFLMPDEDAAGGVSRLAALVVAQEMEPAAILAALRQKIDPAFLPRPLRKVPALPRDSLGKLPRADMLRLLGAEPAPILLHFAADHPVGPGHFPGNPIIPGAVLLDRLVSTLCPNGSAAVPSAKFHFPVRPGDTVSITTRLEKGETRFEGRLAGSDRLVLSGAMRPTSPTR